MIYLNASNLTGDAKIESDAKYYMLKATEKEEEAPSLAPTPSGLRLFHVAELRLYPAVHGFVTNVNKKLEPCVRIIVNVQDRINKGSLYSSMLSLSMLLQFRN